MTIHREKNEGTGKLSKTTQVIVHKVKDITLGDPDGGKCELEYNQDSYVLEDKYQQQYWRKDYVD